MKVIACVAAGIALAGCSALTEMPTGDRGVATWLAGPQPASATRSSAAGDGEVAGAQSGSDDVDELVTTGRPECRDVAVTGTRFARTQRCTPVRGSGAQLHAEEQERQDREFIRDQALLEEQRRIEREARERDHASVLQGAP